MLTRIGLVVLPLLLWACDSGSSRPGVDGGTSDRLRDVPASPSDRNASSESGKAYDAKTSGDAHPGSGLLPTPTPTPKGKTFYVAASGSDGNAGTSAAPWATLQHAADSIATGDTVLVSAGNYKGFALDPSSTADGHSDNPIVFRADKNVIIDRTNGAKNNGINLEHSSYVIIEGFTVQPTGGNWDHGIRATSGTGVVIRANRVLMRASDQLGIFSSFSTDLVVEFNEITGTNDAGIYTSNSALRPVVRANLVHDTAGMGIHNNGDASMDPTYPLSAGAVFGQITSALIDANEIVNANNAGGSSALSCDGVQHSRIQNNLIYSISHGKGITLFQVDAAGPSNDNIVVNNTVIMSAGAQSAILVKQAATGNLMQNNIALGGGGTSGAISICSDCKVTSDYNLVTDQLSADDEDSFTSLAAWRTKTSNDAHSAVATAAQLFVAAGAHDYHLAAASPAIDTGTAAQAPAWDHEGTARPQKKGFDVGAYEKP